MQKTGLFLKWLQGGFLTLAASGQARMRAVVAWVARIVAAVSKGYRALAAAGRTGKRRLREGARCARESLARAKRAAVCFLVAPRTLISGVIVMSMLAMSITAVQGYQAGFGTLVLVDEEEVAFIHTEDLEELELYLVNLQAQAQSHYNMEVQPNEIVSYGEAHRSGQHVDLDIVKDELQQRLSFSALGLKVLVEGQVMVTLATRADYEALLEIIAGAYVTNRKNARVLSVDIQEEIECQACPVEPEEIISVEDAANILLTGTDRQETYLVVRGDNLWTIARSYNMTMAELQQANPQIQGTRIYPGDKLNLVLAEPFLNVSVLEEMTVTEKIPFKTTYTVNPNMWKYQTKVLTSGRQGERTVTYQVVLENGREVERIKVSEKITREPVTRIVARGTANVPSLGTGRFGWPLPPGVGVITSPFGWRWGTMHNGVDIASSTGTAIRASDSGIVSYSGFRSSYGNLVIIEHGNGYSTYYAHNSTNRVSQGQQVSKGETIALMGRTGRATGPHLHFEIRYNGNPLNPMKFFSP